MLLPFVIEDISDRNSTVMPNVTKGGLHYMRIVSSLLSTRFFTIPTYTVPARDLFSPPLSSYSEAQDISDRNSTVMPNVTKGGLHYMRIRAERRDLSQERYSLLSTRFFTIPTYTVPARDLFSPPLSSYSEAHLWSRDKLSGWDD
jgi:hypothetical protein